MPDFLDRMARSSAARVATALSNEPEPALLARALATPAPPSLRFPLRGFDVIAEIKRRAPSAGTLASEQDFNPAAAADRARRYAGAGAAAVSVLTEPDSFGGSLEDLSAVASAIRVPVLRKDFLVDPYQVLEARAAGASGVLLIVRMLDGARLHELLEAAARCGLFVLLEAFDAVDLDRCGAALAGAARAVSATGEPHALVGVNTRDLATLATDRGRLRDLRDRLPADVPWVAESGLSTDQDAREVVRLGYRLALIGGALMRAADPARRIAELLAVGREEATRCASA